MRAAMRGLTLRGRSFLAAALAAGVCAMVLGERDLMRVAVLLAVLPLLAMLYVGRARYRLTATRQIEPTRVPVDTPARVSLRLTNLSRMPTGTMMLEDHLPYSLGTRPRLVLERLGGQQTSVVAYAVRGQLRGRYDVGPLVVRLTDPFHLCQTSHSFASVARLTVVPRVVNLPMVRLAAEYSGQGESRARSVAVHGEDDIAVREYRQGDDLRRVHWRSTARTGELMVRREEQPWESHATVILDTRRQAHHGDGPSSSFEWAVTAVASIAINLRHNGYRLRLVTGTGIDLETTEADGDGAILDSLAEANLSATHDLPFLISTARRGGNGGLFIAVMGSLAPGETVSLASLRTPNTTCVALLLDPTSWQRLPVEAREQASANHEAAALALRRSGWRVVGASHGADLAALWGLAARGRQDFAWRAAMAETVAPKTATAGGRSS